MDYIHRWNNTRVICRLLNILLLFGLFKIQHISPWMFSSTQRSARFREFILYWIGWNPKEWYQRIIVGRWVCVCLCVYIYICIFAFTSQCVCIGKCFCVCLYCACVCNRLVCVCVHTVPVCVCTCCNVCMHLCIPSSGVGVNMCRPVCLLTALS